jgi:hypothetical protein
MLVSGLVCQHESGEVMEAGWQQVSWEVNLYTGKFSVPKQPCGCWQYCVDLNECHREFGFTKKLKKSRPCA